MIITIDGPAGSGKSTAARKLAARLGIAYLDTGAMYRVVTLAALEDDVDMRDAESLARVAATAAFDLDCGPTHVRVHLRGRDVTEEVRSMRVSEHTRFVAGAAGVRRVLVEKQRALGARLGSMVTEGRDQGSVAFPHADFKFFLDAAIEKRAERRFHELSAEGEEVAYERVLENLRTRDETDSQRAVAPLRCPDDAVRIDTTNLPIAQVLEQMLDQLRASGVTIPDPEHSQRV